MMGGCWRDEVLARLRLDDDASFYEQSSTRLADVDAAYGAYVDLSASFFARLAPSDARRLGMAPTNADCRGEVLLLLLGLKPSVLFAFGTWAGFADAIGDGLVRPWVARVAGPVAARLAVGRVDATCQVQPGVDFQGAVVLYDTSSPRARDVALAFFSAPGPGDAPILMSQVGRALGYPSRHGARRNSRVAFAACEAPGSDFSAPPPDAAEASEFLVEGPSEIPAAARYYLHCAAACAPRLPLAFALCGVVVPPALVRAVAEGTRVGDVGAAVAAANRGRAPVLESE